MKNIVIAAGYATRLGELTKNFPKTQSVLSFGAKERTKENIHPSQALPYMEEM